MSELVCREAATGAELQACFAIRRKVFVEEQNLFADDDRDEHDAHAIHYLAISRGTIIGTVRIYPGGDGLWWGGRLAVLKRHRGRAGRALIQACVDRVRREGARQFRACVQQENVAFFKTLGWSAVGQAVTVCNRPHQVMEASL
jgi:putative N-acetyltransferase (TIGR04045 family)